MVSDEAKKVLKTYKENSTHSTLDEALTELLEKCGITT